MRRKSTGYTEGEIGRVRVVRDFLPARTKLRKRSSGNVFADLGLPNP
jgi:hypothetical protein